MHIPDEVVAAVLASQPKTETIVEVSEVVEILKEAPATIEQVTKNLVEEKTNKLIDDYVEKLRLDYPAPTTSVKNKNTTKKIAISEEIDLVACLEKTKSLIESITQTWVKQKELKHMTNPFMFRPGAFVAKIIDLSKLNFEKINSYERLKELFSNVSPSAIHLEKFYYGSDNKHVRLFRINLPVGYLASITGIKLKDMPRQYFHDRKIVYVIRETKRANSLPIELCCEQAGPVLSTDPGMEEYHVLSLKVDNNTGTIAQWLPGLHPKHYRYNDDQEKLCALGTWEHKQSGGLISPRIS
jgi:hypothetical protein